MKNGLAIAVCGASAPAAAGAVREGLNASVNLAAKWQSGKRDEMQSGGM
ncbi:MAG TPA: hypothetical protein PKE45_25780 [Caldilineaceae bacterium]|nr:hypothetical protein [Caldilineaceae bacterium]